MTLSIFLDQIYRIASAHAWAVILTNHSETLLTPWRDDQRHLWALADLSKLCLDSGIRIALCSHLPVVGDYIEIWIGGEISPENDGSSLRQITAIVCGGVKVSGSDRVFGICRLTPWTESGRRVYANFVFEQNEDQPTVKAY